VVFKGGVYPLRRGGVIDLQDEFEPTARCPAIKSLSDLDIQRLISLWEAYWFLDTADPLGASDYLLLSGDDKYLENAVDAVESAGIEVNQYGSSTRPASNELSYSWWIRVQLRNDTGAELSRLIEAMDPLVAERDQRSIDAIAKSPSPGEATRAVDKIMGLTDSGLTTQVSDEQWRTARGETSSTEENPPPSEESTELRRPSKQKPDLSSSAPPIRVIADREPQISGLATESSVDHLRSSNEQLRSENSSIKQDFEAAEVRVGTLRARASEMADVISDLEAKVSARERLAQGLEERIAALQAEVTQTSSVSDKAPELSEAHQKEMDELGASNVELQKQLSEAMKEWEDEDQKSRRLEGLLEQEKEVQSELQEDLERVRTQVVQMRQRIGAFEQTDVHEVVEQMLAELCPDLEFKYGSFDVICNTLRSRNSIMGILRKLSSGSAPDDTRKVRTTTTWSEASYRTNIPNVDGRVYFQLSQDPMGVLVSLKTDQDRDIQRLRRLDGGRSH